MKSLLLRIALLVAGVIILLGYSDNPPNGHTGAPFDSSCNACHGGNNPGGYAGTVAISGLPNPIPPNSTFQVTLTATITAGNPIRAGFQLVAVQGNNANAGDLQSVDTETGTEMLSGREYIDHRNPKNFNANPTVSWTFNWTSPAFSNGNVVTFYFVGNFTNGDNTSSGDLVVSSAQTFNHSGTAPLSATITNVTHVSCFGGSNGSATVTPSGGTPPYFYAWPNGQTTATATNLMAGAHIVTVTDNAGGSTTASASVNQPSQILINLSNPATITCAQSTASVTATVGGGTPGYTYLWSNGSTSSTLVTAAAGPYSLTVTDTRGCTRTAQVTIQQNTTPPVAVAGAPQVISCSQPQATLSGVGSSTGAGIQYNWTTSNGNIVSGGNTLTPLVNQAGTYTLTVLNTANGCSATANTNITGNTNPPTAVAGPTQNISCPQPQVTLNGTGSSTGANMQYAWTTTNGHIVSGSNTLTPIVNQAGTYTLTVLNTQNNCSATANVSVTGSTTPPTAMAGPTAEISCSQPQATLNGIGSSQGAGIQYTWSTSDGHIVSGGNTLSPVVDEAGTYTLTVLNTNTSCSSTSNVAVTGNTSPPTVVVTGGELTCNTPALTLDADVDNNGNPVTYAWTGPNGFSDATANPEVDEAGSYILTVTSVTNGCTAVDSAQVIDNSDAPVVSIANPGQLTCALPAIQLNALGSSQGLDFSYNWTTANGNIVTGANTLTPTVNAPGTYNLVITNNNNSCTASGMVSVTQASTVSAVISATTDVSCAGGSDGSATVTADGSGTLTYEWATGATTPTVTGLMAGTYPVTVSDENNCTAVVTANIGQPAELTLDATATHETANDANDGTATATAQGGMPAYAYIWSNGAISQTISGLAPGIYSVSVTDANGCTAVQTVTVNAFNCSINVSLSSDDVTCFGQADGSAMASVNGALAPVSYQWSNGAITPGIDNLAAGTYSVTVEDAAGCPAGASITVNEPALLTANATATSETSSGANDGTATVNPQGGSSPYAVLWSNGAQTLSIQGLLPGSYTVSVTDANGCQAVQTLNVNAFNCALAVDAQLTDVACFGENSGAITLAPTGGTAPFNYQWSNGAIGPTIGNLSAGDYSVTIMDELSCVLTNTFTIQQPSQLSINPVTVNHVECPEDHDGQIIVAAEGGVVPYTYLWSHGAQGPVAFALVVDTYTVSLTDANGCMQTLSVDIIAQDTIKPLIECEPDITLCEGDVLIFNFPAVTDNCGLPLMITQTEGLPSGSVFPLGETLQTFEVADQSGNTAECSHTITVSPVPELAFDINGDINNSGTGSIQVNVESGNVVQYFWIGPDDFTAETGDIEGLVAGVYLLRATEANGCSAEYAVQVPLVVGTDFPQDPVSLRLYPNPATDHIQIDMQGAIPVAAQLFDVRGRLWASWDTENLKAPLDVTALPAGVYVVSVVDNRDNRFLLRWVKM